MMIPATFTVAGVVERDIDLLLLEEFLSSELFSRWFIQNALHPPGRSNDLGQVRRAGRSVTQSMGESDLEIVFEAADGSRTYLLIENKVNAVFQPAQAERYHLRGRTYIERGDCTAVYTVLIAPERYFGSSNTCQGFDGRLSYEALHDWFLDQHGMGPRRIYKAGILAAAIEKAHYGYQAEADAPVTTFWRAYWELAVTEAPGLQMDMPPPKPAGAGFVRFRPAGIAAPVSLIHKLPRGCVDLQVTAGRTGSRSCMPLSLHTLSRTCRWYARPRHLRFGCAFPHLTPGEASSSKSKRCAPASKRRSGFLAGFETTRSSRRSWTDSRRCCCRTYIPACYSLALPLRWGNAPI